MEPTNTVGPWTPPTIQANTSVSAKNSTSHEYIVALPTVPEDYKTYLATECEI
jgi:hypothetical protein